LPRRRRPARKKKKSTAPVAVSIKENSPINEGFSSPSQQGGKNEIRKRKKRLPIGVPNTSEKRHAHHAGSGQPPACKVCDRQAPATQRQKYPELQQKKGEGEGSPQAQPVAPRTRIKVPQSRARVKRKKEKTMEKRERSRAIPT